MTRLGGQAEDGEVTSSEAGTGSNGCGPGCACTAQAENRRVKALVGTAVLCAAVGILGYRVFAARQAAATAGPADFGAAVAFGEMAGRPLDAVSDLNRFAMDMDAVFVIVPDRKGQAIAKPSQEAVLSAHRLLTGKGLKVGLFTLKASSADYRGIASQVPVPAILVIAKGRGMSVVTGEATQDKVLQAFVSSSRASSCAPGTPGCAPGACR